MVKTSDLRKLLLNLRNKTSLKRSCKYVTLSNLSVYCTWKNIKKPCKNNKFKILALTCNEEFELPDGSYLYQIFQFTLKTLITYTN